MSEFKWTDELVLLALDLAHHNGYHKFPQRCVEVVDEVKKQAMRSGYIVPDWINEHIRSKQQPLENKDWEIVSFAFKSEPDKIYNKRESGYWWENKFKVSVTGEPSTEYIEIKSVLILSDNEVFSIGDVIEFGSHGNLGNAKIERFDIDYFDKTRIAAYNGAFGLGYKRWKHAKEPLFTTEDNKPVYEGDTAYYIEEERNFNMVIHANITIKNDRKYFSTEDAAKEYIKKHKPLYTEEDMRECFNQSRLHHPIHPIAGFKHDTFWDYIKSLNK